MIHCDHIQPVFLAVYRPALTGARVPDVRICSDILIRRPHPAQLCPCSPERDGMAPSAHGCRSTRGTESRVMNKLFSSPTPRSRASSVWRDATPPCQQSWPWQPTRKTTCSLGSFDWGALSAERITLQATQPASVATAAGRHRLRLPLQTRLGVRFRASGSSSNLGLRCAGWPYTTGHGALLSLCGTESSAENRRQRRERAAPSPTEPSFVAA